MTDKDRLDFLEDNPEIFNEVYLGYSFGSGTFREAIDRAYKRWAERQDLLDKGK